MRAYTRRESTSGISIGRFMRTCGENQIQDFQEKRLRVEVHVKKE